MKSCNLLLFLFIETTTIFWINWIYVWFLLCLSFMNDLGWFALDLAILKSFTLFIDLLENQVSISISSIIWMKFIRAFRVLCVLEQKLWEHLIEAKYYKKIDHPSQWKNKWLNYCFSMPLFNLLICYRNVALF